MVLSLLVDGIGMVLKATTEQGRLLPAALEIELLTAPVTSGWTPRLMASAVGSTWVAVATEECQPLGPIEGINGTTWLAIGKRLASFHLRSEQPGMIPETVKESVAGKFDAGPWDALGAASDVRRAAELLSHSAASTFSRVLEHGDSHIENILRDPTGELVWIDWQEARIGDGISDLVFLWQRAEFAGAHPPRSEMTGTYAQVRGLDPRELQARLELVELSLLIHAWPPYLSYGNPSARQIMRRRLAKIVDGLVGPVDPGMTAAAAP